MSICSKCQIDKPVDQYETYWHSRKNKHYTRRVCNECMSLQKKQYKFKIRQEKLKLIPEPITIEIPQPDEPELVVEDFSNNDEYKLCPACEEYLPLSKFYTSKQSGRIFKKCKECHIESSKKATQEYWENKRNTFGSERITQRPNTYLDDVQRKQTHWVMELLGWTYNDNGVWSKEGIKDKDKNWVNVPKVPKVVKVKKGPRPRAQLDMDKVKQLREQGLTFNAIGRIFKVSGTTIIKYFYKDEEN